jgi:hypothetical protein
VSHETYTPARGGSASAEINALRRVFGNAADQIVIANTKGFTGHAMGTGIEDVLAVKSLETGVVPPVANFKEVDPELGVLNLSKGGAYPVDYALRLGAGFGSQISMSLLRWIATTDGVRRRPNALGYAYRITDQKVPMRWGMRIALPIRKPGQHGSAKSLVTRQRIWRSFIARCACGIKVQRCRPPRSSRNLDSCQDPRRLNRRLRSYQQLPLQSLCRIRE